MNETSKNHVDNSSSGVVSNGTGFDTVIMDDPLAREERVDILDSVARLESLRDVKYHGIDLGYPVESAPEKPVDKVVDTSGPSHNLPSRQPKLNRAQRRLLEQKMRRIKKKHLISKPIQAPIGDGKGSPETAE